MKLIVYISKDHCAALPLLVWLCCV